jgi:hypothetical protein
MAPADATYRGSPKHKNRPALGRKGTICPEWTHAGLGTGVEDHNWDETEAHGLFMGSEYDPDGSGKVYATARGVAFAAQATADGSWHGYPVSWDEVPAELKDRWRKEKRVSARDLRRFAGVSPADIGWALGTDDE